MARGVPFEGPTAVYCRSASAHEQMFLRAVLSEFRRTGLEETTLGEIYTQMLTLCRTEGQSGHIATCTL